MAAMVVDVPIPISIYIHHLCWMNLEDNYNPRDQDDQGTEYLATQ